MIVLTRNKDESVMIGGDVEITVLEVKGNTVKLEFSDPNNLPVYILNSENGQHQLHRL